MSIRLDCTLLIVLAGSWMTVEVLAQEPPKAEESPQTKRNRSEQVESEDPQKPGERRGGKPQPNEKPSANDTSIDDLLDALEGKLDGSDKSVDGQPKGEKAGSTSTNDLDRLLGDLEAEQPPARRELDEEDRQLDDLLKRFETDPDQPKQQQGRQGGQPDSDSMPQPPGESGNADDPGQPLDQRDQGIDDRLKEILGEQDADPNQSPNQGRRQASPEMQELIRQLREVEDRLKQTDTGETTQEQQEQIVAKLDELIEQMKNSSGGQGSSSSMQQQADQPGSEPGQQQGGDQAGSQAGTPNQRPMKPELDSAVRNAAENWGHLQDKLREEMTNGFSETMLKIKEDLISKYLESVSKKSRQPGR